MFYIAEVEVVVAMFSLVPVIVVMIVIGCGADDLLYVIGSEKTHHLASEFVKHVLFTVFLIRFKVVKRAKVELSYGLLNFGNCTEAL